MKTQIETKKKVMFGGRVPPELKRTFRQASLLAELKVESTVGDALCFYAGSNDKKLIIRRRLFLEAFKMVVESKRLLNPESKENPTESSASVKGGNSSETKV